MPPTGPCGVTLVSVRLTAAITHEAPWYVARGFEVEVASEGETIESAIGNLTEALALYF